MRQVLADRTTYKQMLESMADELNKFRPRTVAEVELVMAQVEARLALLSDERMVLKTFVKWPEHRVEALRECVGRAAELRRLKESLETLHVPVAAESAHTHSSLLKQVEHAAQRMTCAQLMQVMDDTPRVARRTPHVT